MGIAPGIASIQEARFVVEAANDIQRLLALDDLWTRRVDELSEIPSEREIRSLKELGDDIADWIPKVADSVRRLRAVIADIPRDEFDDALNGALDFAGVDRRAFEASLEPVFEEGELRGAVIEACEYVYEMARDARRSVQYQVEDLTRHVPPSGDVPLPWRCALYLASIGAGVASIFVLGPAGAIFQVASLIGGQLGWRESRCINFWRDITGGRR